MRLESESRSRRTRSSTSAISSDASSPESPEEIPPPPAQPALRDVELEVDALEQRRCRERGQRAERPEEDLGSSRGSWRATAASTMTPMPISTSSSTGV
jgi:hypothetical protein